MTLLSVARVSNDKGVEEMVGIWIQTKIVNEERGWSKEKATHRNGEPKSETTIIALK